jgi:Fic family protein
LRRTNQIRSILDSLAIEGNTLTLDQATAIFDGKPVVGLPREILEMQNAIATYRRAASINPVRERDLLDAHRGMMKGLIDDAGRYRTKGVGIFKGSQVAHVAPPANQVPRLMGELLGFLGADKQANPLITSAVAHYELEFIHPFSDGNGRMGRLWQHVFLVRYHPLFENLPFESAIHARQREYYAVLAACDKAGASTKFIEFSLLTIRESLEDLLRDVRPDPATAESRLAMARGAFGTKEFSRREYLGVVKTVSTATASRDLAAGVARKMLHKTADQALTHYRFKT